MKYEKFIEIDKTCKDYTDCRYVCTCFLLTLLIKTDSKCLLFVYLPDAWDQEIKSRSRNRRRIVSF